MVSTRLGIALDATRVRIVLLRGDRLVHAAEAEPGEDAPLEETLQSLLAAAPLPRWPRPSATVALGPSYSQIRRLSGLPELADPRLLEGAIQEGVSRFFTGIPGEAAITGVVRDGPGHAWAGALNRGVVARVLQGCARARVQVRAVVPAVVALAPLCGDGAHRWGDGNVVAEFTTRHGALVTTGRRRPGPEPLAPELVLDSAADLPDLRFADAYAAARVRGSERLALRFGRADTPAWRISVAAAALALALAGAVWLPARRSAAAEREAAAELSRLTTQRRRAATTRRELERTNAALAQITSFTDASRSPVRLLARFAAVLPQGSALVSIEGDSAGGALVALAPRASMVLGALERIPEIEAGEISGPVTREVAAGRPVERVSVRFRFRRHTPSHARGR